MPCLVHVSDLSIRCRRYLDTALPPQLDCHLLSSSALIQTWSALDLGLIVLWDCGTTWLVLKYFLKRGASKYMMLELFPPNHSSEAPSALLP